MSAKFVRFMAWVLVLTSFAAAVPTLASRLSADANPLLALGFDTCAGKPCFMGITPGVTSWLDIELLAGKGRRFTYEALLGWSGRLQFEAFNPLGVANTDSPSDLSIGWYQQPIGDVHEFVLLYGMPCQVQVGRRGITTYVLVYPSILVTAESVADRVSLSSPVRHFIITERTNNCNLQAQARKQWTGFQHLQRYLAQNTAS
jgi:hypothetical protein